jgi:uncharacterized membrane protein HdeD (DUF308 family)
MKIVDAYILARTKRKTRRIRTALVVIISSLLFAVLFGVALVAQGVRDTAEQVKDVGFNGRNMVMVGQTGGPSFDYVAEQKKIEDAMTAELRAKGIKVSEQTKLDPSWQREFMTRLMKMSNERSAQSMQQFKDELGKLGSPKAIYEFSSLDYGYFAQYLADPAIDPLAEELKRMEVAGNNTPKGGEQFNQFQFFSAPKDMLRTQVQPGYHLSWKVGEPYPLVISYAYLEELAKQSFAKVDAADKNQAYRRLMQTYSGKELQYCYRSTTAQEQLRQVVHYNYTAQNDKDNTTKPVDVPFCANFDQKLLKKLSLLPDESTTEKPLFKAPPTPAPESYVMKFRIVGFMPSSSPFGGGDVISRIFTDVSTLPAPEKMGVIPAEVVAQERLLQHDPNGFGMGMPSLFADFETREEQKAFIDKGCSGNDCSSHKRPYIQPFGSVSLALEDTFKTASKFIFIAMGVVMVIAALMIMFTISKVISDSTKEIAVFRSLGARRRDIAQIYYTYGLMLAIASLVLSVVVAIIGSVVATSMFGQRLADRLVQAVGAYNTDVDPTLSAANWQWLGLIGAAMLVAALLGITVPILASLRRKLINILREE